MNANILCRCIRFHPVCGNAQDISEQSFPSLSEERRTSMSGSPLSDTTPGSIKANLLYKSENDLRIGEVFRFIIRYTDLGDSRIQCDEKGRYIWLRVRNNENNFLRLIYLTGPFAFYIDVTPHNFNPQKKFDDEILYDTDVKPGVSFKAKLYLNKNSLVSDNIYSWTVDIISQLTLVTDFVNHFSFLVGFDYRLLRSSQDEIDSVQDQVMYVNKLDTTSIWSQPPKFPNKPVHLVILTHGIFSTVGADMLYLRDEIYNRIASNDNANIIIRGCEDNTGKSDKGIKYLGKRVGDYVLKLYDESGYNIDRVSFIGHSLGGPVQAYAVFHIVSRRPEFFRKVIPLNFLVLASPLLGISSEFSTAASFALDLGVLGVTGRDLTLKHKFPSLIKTLDSESTSDEHIRLTLRPILEQILRTPVHGVFERFLRRTTYANAINDGIVPLRTSALLYLDWKSLGQVSDFKTAKSKQKMKEQVDERGSPAASHEMTSEGINSYDNPNQERAERKEAIRSITSPNLTEGKKAFENITLNLNFTRKGKVKRYLRTQTVDPSSMNTMKTSNHGSSGDLRAEEVDEALDNMEERDPEVYIPPVASTFVSGFNAILSPQPGNRYLTDPLERPETIFHDKIYKFSDLPPPHYPKADDDALGEESKIMDFFFPNTKKIQERLARSWHSGMDWRKVLVTLRPDAHNNIIVRRKYVNAWGWGVIQHLVDNHFSEQAIERDNAFVEIMKKKMSHS